MQFPKSSIFNYHVQTLGKLIPFGELKCFFFVWFIKKNKWGIGGWEEQKKREKDVD